MASQKALQNSFFTSILGSPNIESLDLNEILELIQSDQNSSRWSQINLPTDLIDYIFAVSASCGCGDKTRYNAVHVMNEYGTFLKGTTSKKLSSKTVQAAALASVLISSKLHDSNQATITKLQQASGYTLKREELLQAELSVLKAINFDLHATSPHDLMELFLASCKAKIDSELYSISTCIIDLTYTRKEYMNRQNWSLIAAASVLLASRIADYNQPVLQTVSKLSKYTAGTIEETSECFYKELFRLSRHDTPSHPLAYSLPQRALKDIARTSTHLSATEITLFSKT